MADSDKATIIPWRDVVEAADPTPEDRTEYEFSGGKKFKTPSGGRVTPDEE